MKTFKKSILSAAILGLGMASLPMQAQAAFHFSQTTHKNKHRL